MRRTATGLLVLMAGLFVLAEINLGRHWGWGYLHAFAEAGMIGGIADWFAVTALFRRPLGLPIPHTAIVPENKNRIADTMAQFLRTNFLTPQVVARRMEGMNLAAAVGAYLAAPREAASSRIGTGARDLAVEVLQSLDPQRLGTQVRAGLAAQIERVQISPMLGQLLAAMIADGRHRPLIDSLIRWAGLVLEDNEDTVRAMIQRRANALLRLVGLDERLANSVIDGLYRMLAEVLVDPDHPLRLKVEQGLADFAHRLQHDADLRARVERMKNDFVTNPAVGSWWQGVWERLREGLIAGLRDGRGVSGQLSEALRDMGLALERDARLQHQVNRLARRSAVGLATNYGEQIVRLVSETVKRWDARTVTDRVEGAVGRDLQFIRINGTLVGGLVGVAIHALVGLF
ncbi:DUF445 domain-containing protein [Erythrobacteraceae bacterium CFH 75059]|uniref:DUF445 domain-containing protein n=1 Tax=Qipengyuania thermophila TaxID=2509361 RepID=UPI00101F8B3B|nr:DUF445 domain-containing protein [Qipengyuania thermophila]TCD06983.1 DUF445 domain-containing protein [Erythrobacteraceae bacterium CFH 75059]